MALSDYLKNIMLTNQSILDSGEHARLYPHSLLHELWRSDAIDQIPFIAHESDDFDDDEDEDLFNDEECDEWERDTNSSDDDFEEDDDCDLDEFDENVAERYNLAAKLGLDIKLIADDPWVLIPFEDYNKINTTDKYSPTIKYKNTTLEVEMVDFENCELYIDGEKLCVWAGGDWAYPLTFILHYDPTSDTDPHPLKYRGEAGWEMESKGTPFHRWCDLLKETK